MEITWLRAWMPFGASRQFVPNRRASKSWIDAEARHLARSSELELAAFPVWRASQSHLAADEARLELTYAARELRAESARAELPSRTELH